MSLSHHAGPPPTLPPPVAQWSSRTLIDTKDDLVDAVVAALRERNWVDGDGETWARLCFEEAITNAMLHGNQGDPDLQVEISLHQDGDRWIVLVKDAGDGFDPASLQTVPDDDDMNALLREHGRGIPLMREWLDELTWYDHGASVFLARHLDLYDHNTAET